MILSCDGDIDDEEDGGEDEDGKLEVDGDSASSTWLHTYTFRMKHRFSSVDCTELFIYTIKQPTLFSVSCSSVMLVKEFLWILFFWQIQVKKALELYEQLRQRMGVVVVGPSGSGKSTTWQILRAALNNTGQVVKQYTMNPKAMPRTQVSLHMLRIQPLFLEYMHIRND